MSFSDLGLLPELLRAVADKGYDVALPHPSAGHSRGARRPRRARRRTNRHRQNGRLRAAHPAAAASPMPRAAAAARRVRWCSPPRASSPRRSRRARAITASIVQASHHPGIRRREHQSADQRAAQRLRYSGGDAGPLARSRAAARGGSVARCRCWCSMKPIACSTWASSPTSGASSSCCRRSARTCCSPRPIPTTSGRSPSACCTIRCRFRWRRATRPSSSSSSAPIACRRNTSAICWCT